jgi:4-diphosphocytidyl-2-C-methyl-D-erythritol kinase
MILEAPAKLNLCLYVGPVRDDGLHEICSIFQPLDLADRLTITEGVEADEVRCPGIAGPELGGLALRALREAGWDSPPVLVEIDKRIPVAAGLGGGSADAAAVLSLARGSLDERKLRALAVGLGADVASQLPPRRLLVGGSGEEGTPLPAPPAHAIVLVPFEAGLAAREVYEEFDRLSVGKDPRDLGEARQRVGVVAAAGDSPLDYLDLLINDLQPAAVSLRPEIDDALDALRGAGAAVALMTGSGPTVFGLFRDRAEAERAADALAPRYDPIVAEPRREDA